MKLCKISKHRDFVDTITIKSMFYSVHKPISMVARHYFCIFSLLYKIRVTKLYHHENNALYGIYVCDLV